MGKILLYLYFLLSVENKAIKTLVTYCNGHPTPILNGKKWNTASNKNSQASKNTLRESFLKSCPLESGSVSVGFSADKGSTSNL